MTRISPTQTVQMIDTGTIVVADESTGYEITYQGIGALDRLYALADSAIEGDFDSITLHDAAPVSIEITEVRAFRDALDYFIKETIAAQRGDVSAD